MITLILASVISVPAWSDDGLELARQDEISRVDRFLFNSIADDVYVQLYLTRLVRSKMGVIEQEAAVQYALNNLKRMKLLYERNAVSKDELEMGQRDYDAQSAKLDQIKARVEEMRAMFNIAVDRVSVGLDMPICSEIP